MATTYKVLAQANPAATTETTLYTVPSGYSSIVSTIAVCNQAGTSGTFRIAVRPAADGSTTAKHWIVYGATLAASDATMLTLGITAAAGDVIRVYTSSANISFSVFGSEIN
jgi:hypothetical protein